MFGGSLNAFICQHLGQINATKLCGARPFPFKKSHF